jgi:hypothetical protein
MWNMTGTPEEQAEYLEQVLYNIGDIAVGRGTLLI